MCLCWENILCTLSCLQWVFFKRQAVAYLSWDIFLQEISQMHTSESIRLSFAQCRHTEINNYTTYYCSCSTVKYVLWSRSVLYSFRNVQFNWKYAFDLIAPVFWLCTRMFGWRLAVQVRGWNTAHHRWLCRLWAGEWRQKC